MAGGPGPPREGRGQPLKSGVQKRREEERETRNGYPRCGTPCGGGGGGAEKLQYSRPRQTDPQAEEEEEARDPKRSPHAPEKKTPFSEKKPGVVLAAASGGFFS